MAARQIEEYFAEVVRERKQSTEERDDILSLFLTAEIEGQRLTVDEIVGICFLFILAGLDTVTDSLECFFAYLAQHPAQRQRIVDDPSIIPSTVEELLRWESPVTAVARTATADLELEGCPIHKGSSIGVSIGVGQHRRGSAARLLHRGPERNPNKHLAFGGGIHRCLGSHLARMELRIALREWHQRIPDYSLAPGAELIYQPGLRQIDKLPLVFAAGGSRG